MADVIEALRAELNGKRVSELTPWQRLMNALLWCRDNSAYGISTSTLDEMLTRAAGLRVDEEWRSAKAPPDSDELMVVWLKEGWMAVDNYEDGKWQSLGDEVVLWRKSPPTPHEDEITKATAG